LRHAAEHCCAWPWRLFSGLGLQVQVETPLVGQSKATRAPSHRRSSGHCVPEVEGWNHVVWCNIDIIVIVIVIVIVVNDGPVTGAYSSS
jgi:hypothetical protein